eukprot:CAMPEP_0113593260 /NCGR_PEP_ID=MMETSP0015_2-20120614/38331_1 /TAXON_ID=2838 /ORGANISM="Odontella" /LENGTH=74 /DNA_ID=CAMNT_0000499943 /DNA_START=36 /DNA_END=257 /DNA_ORIENTATION=- /assembly_acc=CAM_ASM_000160
MFFSSFSIKPSHLLARDPAGRTPLHLSLLRYAAGSIRRNDLSLRRAPDDVVLGLLEKNALAAGVPDENGMMPLH